MTFSPGVRIARATSRLANMERFYRRGLGFGLVDRFEDHGGYTGVILAMPGGAHLEITQHARGRGGSAPDADDLLVLYLPSAARVARRRRRLESLGYARVPPLNPYWLDKSVTFADPDGWRVVLCEAASRQVHDAADSSRERSRGATKSRKARSLPLARRSRT
jgi:catechol 2,3-dioxygenase-like lactoylglutathione lyase family enzyme